MSATLFALLCTFILSLTSLVLNINRQHPTINTPFSGSKVDFRNLCSGFLYETEDSNYLVPSIEKFNVPSQVKEFLQTHNLTLVTNIEAKTIPHFITICDLSSCITYSSKDFCDLLINLGTNY